MMTAKRGAPAGAMVVDEDADDVVVVVMEQLAIGEVELAEELSGQSITTLFDDTTPKARLLRGIAVAIRRRTNPDFTWEQAGSLRVFMGMREPVPPTNGSASPSKSRSRSTSRSSAGRTSKP